MTELGQKIHWFCKKWRTDPNPAVIVPQETGIANYIYVPSDVSLFVKYSIYIPIICIFIYILYIPSIPMRFTVVGFAHLLLA